MIFIFLRILGNFFLDKKILLSPDINFFNKIWIRSSEIRNLFCGFVNLKMSFIGYIFFLLENENFFEFFQFLIHQIVKIERLNGLNNLF